MSVDGLQRYQWTMSGMRPTETEFGAMPYYRMADVEDLVRGLTASHARAMEAALEMVRELQRKLRYATNPEEEV
jgi:hypothetical protein